MHSFVVLPRLLNGLFLILPQFISGLFLVLPELLSVGNRDPDRP